MMAFDIPPSTLSEMLRKENRSHSLVQIDDGAADMFFKWEVDGGDSSHGQVELVLRHDGTWKATLLRHEVSQA